MQSLLHSCGIQKDKIIEERLKFAILQIKNEV